MVDICWMANVVAIKMEETLLRPEDTEELVKKNSSLEEEDLDSCDPKNAQIWPKTN